MLKTYEGRVSVFNGRYWVYHSTYVVEASSWHVAAYRLISAFEVKARGARLRGVSLQMEVSYGQHDQAPPS